VAFLRFLLAQSAICVIIIATARAMICDICAICEKDDEDLRTTLER
jgi:hypothetical protein